MDTPNSQNWKVIEDVAKWLVPGIFSVSGWVVHWRQRRRDLFTARMDRARDNAARLEQYAYDAHDLVEGNNDSRPDAGPFTFNLPPLDDAEPTGDRHRDHSLLNAYRDLQVDIERATRQVNLTDRGDFYGFAALDTFDRRAYRVAARALELATDYRRRVGMRRAPLAPHELNLERYIRDRARVDAGQPTIVRLTSRVRYALARRRLARDGYNMP
ncbi:hypothetical protein [Paraburkholderia unamae]|uniref:Uncharacterized protein n=1 Tax=Paraburkholderia unamae TaxID=219649 RepID=A0ACC6RWN0_9BURK